MSTPEWVYGDDVGMPGVGWISQDDYQARLSPPTQILPVQQPSSIPSEQFPAESEHDHRPELVGAGQRSAAPEWSPNFSGRGAAKVRLIVIHTAEGARTAADLGRYFHNAAVQVSSHVGIDEQNIQQYVPYEQAAWTVRSANPISDNAELCGFAKWTRDEWLNQHRGMLQHTAAWIAERCAARGIPIVKLTPAQVAAGQAGVMGHVDWTVGMKDGSHSDPGPGFPWDVVIAMAKGQAPPSPSTPPRPPVDRNQQLDAMITGIFQQVSGSPNVGEWPGWPSWPGGSEHNLTLVDYIRNSDVLLHQILGQVDALRAEVAALRQGQ